MFEKKPRKLLTLMVLVSVVLSVVIFAVATGPANISFSEVLKIISSWLFAKAGKITMGFPGISNLFFQYASGFAENISESHFTIILNVRLPRVILGFLVGMSLAVAGTCLQAIFKNPMADPYIIGISSGASLGAALAIVLGIKLFAMGVNWGTTLFAFIGALSSVYLVYNIARVEGRVPVATLLLAGVAVAAFLSAGVSFLMLFSAENLHGIVFWIMGSLAVQTWVYVKMILPFALLGSFFIFFHARNLNVILLGEETAQYLGVEVERVKKTLFIASSLVVGAAVAVSGVIGFVGLIIPHVVRLLVGPDHRVLLPVATFTGGVFLVLCDTLARTAIAPTEIPVGVITALMGAPFFIYLLVHRKGYFF